MAGKAEIIEIAGRTCYCYNHSGGALDVPLLVQPVDEYSLEYLDKEVAEIERLAWEQRAAARSAEAAQTDAAVHGGVRVGGHGFRLVAFRVGNWNNDLSPWEAPPAFGNEPFGGGAAETLAYIENELLPELCAGGKRVNDGNGGAPEVCGGTPEVHGGAPEVCGGTPEVHGGAPEVCGGTSEIHGDAPEVHSDESGVRGGVPVILGGYSLAGLFALWAGTVSERFSGIAAASPSVWFPGWIEYAEEHWPRGMNAGKQGCTTHTAQTASYAAETHPLQRVYLSLGDKEERTRNTLMRRVGDCIRRQDEIFTAVNEVRRENGADELAHTLVWEQGNHFREPELRTARAFAWVLGETSCR